MYLYRIFVWCCRVLSYPKMFYAVLWININHTNSSLLFPFNSCIVAVCNMVTGQLAPPNSDYAGFRPDMWALELWLQTPVMFPANSLLTACHISPKSTLILTSHSPTSSRNIALAQLSSSLTNVPIWLQTRHLSPQIHTGFIAVMLSLEASIFIVEGLQLSSFIFTVPQNRPLSGPMIWQEWQLGPVISVFFIVFPYPKVTHLKHMHHNDAL